MAKTDPRTWVTGEIVTAAIMNTHVRDNFRYIMGEDGVPTIKSGLILDNTDGDEYFRLPSLTTAERNALTPANGMLIYNETDGHIDAYQNGAWDYWQLGSGVIVIWSGTIASIPAGFVICDGNNSTPNLLAKFIEGVATAATNPGATGGSLTPATSGHTHDQNMGSAGSIQTSANFPVSAAGGSDSAMNQGAGTVGYTPVHTGVASNTDTVTDSRPPYYDVAFIMKT